MSWGPYPYRVITILLVCCSATFVSVHSISNATLEDGIPVSSGNTSKELTIFDLVVKNCKQPSFKCLQKSVYDLLNSTMNPDREYKIYDFIHFVPNHVNPNTTFGNSTDDNNSSMINFLEDLTSKFHNKALNFLATHDIQLQLPDTQSNETIFKLSPRFIDNATLTTNLQIFPDGKLDSEVTPRIFLKQIKKIISGKLLNALLAILLVIALIKVKLMFFIPMVVGMATAKKLLLKLLLFVFPFLAHIFKLCPYYASAEGTKFHHHDHKIAHIHHLPPVIKHHPHHHPHPPHPPHFHKHHPGIEYHKPPGYIKEVVWDRDSEQDNREETEDHAWIMSHGNVPSKYTRKPTKGRPLTPFELDALAIRNEAKLKLRLQQEQLRIEAENKLLQDQLKQALKIQERLKLHTLYASKHIDNHQSSNKISNVQHNVPLTTNIMQIPSSTTEKLTTTTTPTTTTTLRPKDPFYEAVQKAAAITFDPFYSPILEKIDQILAVIGFREESCKERVICSMYKNPENFSPHSNLLSAQLSRDADELQKPTTNNAAVVRFYRYVQAARDGQDKRECLRLYPSCAINTEI